MTSKILAFLLAIIPVASIYAFPFLINNLGNAIQLFLCLPIIIISIIKNKKFLVEKTIIKYLFFTIYAIFISLISFTSYYESESFKALISFSIFSMLLICYMGFKDLFPYFLKYYKSLSILFSIFLILQYLAFYLLSIELTGFIPFLKTYEDLEGATFVLGHNDIVRISSVFSEPSHFALYVMPALCIYLFNLGGKSKQRFAVIIIISLSTILSTSGNGIVLLFITVSAYIILKYFKRLTFRHLIFGAALFVIFITIFLKSSFIQSSTYSLFTLQEGRSESKAKGRIYRGFVFFNDLPTSKKTLGIGWRNAENFAKTNTNLGLYEKHYLRAYDYFNSIAGIMIYFGIIGFIIFMSFIISIWRKITDPGGKVIIIIILATMTSSSIIMTDIWPLYLIIMFSAINLKSNLNYHS